ncbi:MAG: Na+/H+ antiporter subunit D [Candidatus Promineifilaceae bacterium]|nr:Na+/H+ antiporter subunit D [Candidatus Promineifilaceae bacterium]
MAIVLPILIPLITAIILLLFWWRRSLQRAINTLGTVALLATGIFLLVLVWQDGIQTVQLGNWPAPYGITLVADLLAATLVVLAGLMGLAVGVYSLVAMDVPREEFGFYPLFQLLLMGVCGAFLTGDMFNLYVWFEVMLISSFVLLALGGQRLQLEGAIKYVTINLMSSAIFLAAVGILYSIAGTLNMADLALALPNAAQPRLVTLLALLFLIAFGVKAAIFPLFFWLPASYHTPPLAVSAIFSGLLTKVGVYALLRTFTLMFPDVLAELQPLFLLLAGLTMIAGILGALARREIRRILSFNIVSHIGYMVMGLAIFTPLAVAGSIAYILHHIVVITTLFLVAGQVRWLRGSYQLDRVGGLYQEYPLVALLFLIPALALAGIPPLSGFWPKVALIQAGLAGRHIFVVVAALLTGLLTLYSMGIIWSEAFWKPGQPTANALGSKLDLRLLGPVVGLVLLIVLIGLLGGPVFDLSQAAADQLLNPTGYIEAVLP